MVIRTRSWSLPMLVAGMMLATASTQADDTEAVIRLDDPSVGVVRITDRVPQNSVVRGQSPDGTQGEPQPVMDYTYSDEVYCPPEYYDGDGYGHHHSFGTGKLGQWWQLQLMASHARNRAVTGHIHSVMREDCRQKRQWLHGKFGYFIPSGCGGAGCPPIGHYNMVYPVNPNYFDPRDGQVYAAQGAAGPVSIPLAPVVNHTYNYGWGLPSSRLTTIQHPVATTPIVVPPGPEYPIPGAAPVAR